MFEFLEHLQDIIYYHDYFLNISIHLFLKLYLLAFLETSFTIFVSPVSLLFKPYCVQNGGQYISFGYATCGRV